MGSRQERGKHYAAWDRFRVRAAARLGTALTREDTRQNYGERRFVTIGLIDGVVHVVVHTQREYADRIISVRKANRRERKLYVEATDS